MYHKKILFPNIIVTDNKFCHYCGKFYRLIVKRNVCKKCDMHMKDC